MRSWPACSFGDARAFSCVRGHAISARMSDGTIYQVSIVEKQKSGQNLIRILLRTKDRDEANYLVGSLEQDGQRCKLEIIPPGRGDL